MSIANWIQALNWFLHSLSYMLRPLPIAGIWPTTFSNLFFQKKYVPIFQRVQPISPSVRVMYWWQTGDWCLILSNSLAEGSHWQMKAQPGPNELIARTKPEYGCCRNLWQSEINISSREHFNLSTGFNSIWCYCVWIHILRHSKISMLKNCHLSLNLLINCWWPTAQG